MEVKRSSHHIFKVLILILIIFYLIVNCWHCIASPLHFLLLLLMLLSSKAIMQSHCRIQQQAIKDTWICKYWYCMRGFIIIQYFMSLSLENQWPIQFVYCKLMLSYIMQYKSNFKCFFSIHYTDLDSVSWHKALLHLFCHPFRNSNSILFPCWVIFWRGSWGHREASCNSQGGIQ